jgi:hypothetical protein
MNTKSMVTGQVGYAGLIWRPQGVILCEYQGNTWYVVVYSKSQHMKRDLKAQQYQTAWIEVLTGKWRYAKYQ